jgi:hypothetical protein
VRTTIALIAFVGALTPTCVAAQAPSLAQSVAHERSRSPSSAIGSGGRFFTVVPAPSSSADRMKPSVRCGMTLLPADPKTDPAIRRATPDSTRFAMRAAHPVICGDDSVR